jgi:anti-repressor protein
MGCEVIGNKLTGPKGVNFTIAYVTRFNQMQMALLEQLSGFYIPKTYNEAMRLAADFSDTIERQNQKIAEITPKAEAYNIIMDADTAVDMSEAAKLLKIPSIGRNNLFKMLKEKNVLNSKNTPYQQYVNLGYFRVIEKGFEQDGQTRTYLQTLVTQKGLDFMLRLFGKIADNSHLLTTTYNGEVRQ